MGVQRDVGGARSPASSFWAQRSAFPQRSAHCAAGTFSNSQIVPIYQKFGGVQTQITLAGVFPVLCR